MREPLRILLVEDSKTDSLLILDTLEKAGYTIFHERADTFAAAKDAIKNQWWDLIIADHRLPDFDSRDLLAIKKRHALETPFIVVARDISNEEASKFIDSGAYDYLLKEDLFRLPLAVKRGLETTSIRNELKPFLVAVDHVGDAVIVTDTRGCVQYVNAAFEHMSGYAKDEVVGKSVRYVYADPESELEAIGTVVSSGRVWTSQFLSSRKDGTSYEIEVSVRPVRNHTGRIVNCISILKDVSRETDLQRQLIQSQKMEAVGALAGGVAHDFNNLLTIILGYAELIMMDEKLTASSRQDLSKIVQAGKNGADLVQRLMTFSKKSEFNPQLLDLNEIIARLNQLLSRTIPKMIKIELRLAEHPASINGDPVYMGQVLMNLMVNAQQAMPDGGTLLVETSNVELSVEECSTIPNSRPGKYVCLNISDTGVGMDQTTLGHMFEPFFTTKKAGEGTGLGLATVLEIVARHSGFLKCSSEVGKGTSFKIYFPAIESQRDLDKCCAETNPSAIPERILLVDDEELVRELGRRILSKAGYEVLMASDGREAVSLYEMNGSTVSLVILDLIMPVMGGKECLHKLLKIDPDLKVILSTGKSYQDMLEDESLKGVKGYLIKPYDVNELLRTVRSALHKTAPKRKPL